MIMKKNYNDQLKQLFLYIYPYLNIKIICFILFGIVFFFSSFGIFHGQVTDQGLSLAVMMLLLALFTDLKKFNFWGLTGEKIDKKLEDLTGKSGINEDNAPKPTSNQVIKAETVELEAPLQLSDSNKGNLLTIAFELERILKLAAIILSGDKVVQKDVLKVLQLKKLLNPIGAKQIELIRKVKNVIFEW
jgi:hypothetical protein